MFVVDDEPGKIKDYGYCNNFLSIQHEHCGG